MHQGHGCPKRRLAGALVVVALALLAVMPAGAGAATGPFWNPYTSITSTTTVAGAHPDVTISAWFCTHFGDFNNCSPTEFGQSTKNVKAVLPSGLVGNPSATLKCAPATFAAMTATSSRCSDQSIIGDVTVAVVGTQNGPRGLLYGKAYNLKPRGSELARVGVYINGKEAPNASMFNVYEPFRVEMPVTLEGTRVVTTATNLPDRPIISGSPVAGPKIKISDITMTLRGNVGSPATPFIQNPTSCTPGTLNIESSDGTTVSKLETLYAATACASVPFAPSLAVSAGATGETARNSSPPVDIGVAIPDDQSAITTSQITLPSSIRPSVAALNAHSCTAGQAAAGSCGNGSRIGSVTIRSPLSEDSFSGPVYLVREPGVLRAKLIARIGGGADMDLEGTATFSGNRTVATFSDLPDIPFSSFTISLYGGNDGVFTAASDLCGSPLSAESTLTSKSGKVSAQQVPVAIEGCKPASLSIKAGAVTVHSGFAPIVLSCSNKGASCAGALALGGVAKGKKSVGPLGQATFKVAAGSSATVGVKLTSAAKRALGRSRSVKASAVATLKGSTAKQAIALKAEPREKKAKKAKKKRSKKSKRRR